MRLFFHNNQDKNSTQILNSLDSTVTVYDVFGKDKDNLPSNIKISSLPYLIDKYISLDTQPPYKVGTVALDFSCHDYKNQMITNVTSVFYISVNNSLYNYVPNNGMIHLQLNCPNPTTIDISIESNGYLPFQTSIGVS